jgi:hypothetical protein
MERKQPVHDHPIWEGTRFGIPSAADPKIRRERDFYGWLLALILPMVRPIIRTVMVAVMVIPVAVFTVIVTIFGMPLSYGNGNRLRFRRNQSEEP